MPKPEFMLLTYPLIGRSSPAHLVLPRDLTTEEVGQITAFLKTYVMVLESKAREALP